MTSSRRRLAAVLILLALVSSACRRPSPDAELSVQRIALNLAFSDEELVVPVEPEVIVKLIPAPPVFEAPDDVLVFRAPPPEAPKQVFEFTPPCPSAPAGAAPRDPVEFQVSLPPTEGRYERFNQGTISVTGSLIPLQFAYPQQSVWESRNVEDGVTLTEELRKRFQLRRIIAPGFEITDLYEIDGVNLQLVQRDTLVNGVTDTFVPVPSINMYVAGNEGDTWVSSGVDSESETAMVVQGAITTREVVDACGTPVDTYQFTLEEQVVNLATGDTSGTNPGEPNVYNMATHLGGLLVREDVHTITRTTGDAGTPIVVEFDYVGVMNGIDPEPFQ